MHKIRDFHEGHSTVGEGRVVARSRQGNGMVCVNPSLKRQGNSRGTAWEQHGMCESALTLPCHEKAFLKATSQGHGRIAPG
jgi:hypothetical protein